MLGFSVTGFGGLGLLGLRIIELRVLGNSSYWEYGERSEGFMLKSYGV